jgi:hypothetical protein
MRQLTEINRQLELGATAVEDQKRIVTSICVAGNDATEATRLLASMAAAQIFASKSLTGRSGQDNAHRGRHSILTWYFCYVMPGFNWS